VLKKIMIFLPNDIKEQTTIANILSDVDSQIDKLNLELNKTEKIKQELMNKLLIKGINHKKFKQTELGEIPEEWEIITLGNKEYVKVNDNNVVNYPKIFTYIDIESVEGNTGVIKNNLKRISCSNAPSRAKRLISEGDVLMSTVRPYLKAFAIVPIEYNNQICSTGFAVLTTIKNKLNSKFLLYILFSNYISYQINKMMVGGQYPAVNASQVEELLICIPKEKIEQNHIVEILSTIDNKIQLQKKKKEKYERIKKGLMNDLLTGNKRVKVN